MPVIPGKNYEGQKGFPTPDDTPESTACRIFRVPADDQWLGLLMGAVELLTDEFNWYDWGALSPADAAAAWSAIVDKAYADSLTTGCPTGYPTPFWDTATDADDEYPAGELTPWYGTASVTYMSPPDVTFVEQLGIWTIAGFIAYAGQPGAAIAFLTIAPRFVLAFKTGNVGAIVDIIVDASHIATVDTYSVVDGIKRVIVETDPASDTHQIYIVKDDNPDTTVQVIRDELAADSVSPTTQRYNSGTDTIQIQQPDGSWVDTPAADTRVNPAAQFAPITGSNPVCHAASNMSRWMSDLISNTSSTLAVGGDAGGVATLIMALLLELGPFGWLIDVVIALAFVLIGIGSTALAAAFPSSVFDTLTCIFFCHLNTDGQFDAGSFADMRAQVASDIGGTAATVLDGMFAIMGFVGLNNAGVTDLGEPVDCSGCACEWCYQWTGAEIDASGEWALTSNLSYSQYRTLSVSVDYTRIEFGYTWNATDGGTGSGSVIQVDGTAVVLYLPLGGSPNPVVYATPITATSNIVVGLNTASSGGGGVVSLDYIKLKGTGTMPAFTGGAEC